MSLKIKIVFIISLFFCINIFSEVKAQKDSSVIDSAKILRIQRHSVGKAVLFSAVLPGLGQIYNRKIWKVPLIYGGFALSYYYIDFYNGKMNYFIDQYNSHAGNADLQSYDKQGIDFYRRNRDLNIILFAGVYLLNIIDASVDANFFKFDVSDDLSLRIQPTVLPVNMAHSAVGLRCSFTLK